MKIKRPLGFFIVCCLLLNAGFSQKVIPKITNTYFRYNPFDREFKGFLTHLLNDTLLANKGIHKRTDTSFFFFRGIYKNYKTFDLKPIRVEVRLAESEIDLPAGKIGIDTILLYQILIYTNSQNTGPNNVQKEFEKFDHKYRREFSNAISRRLMEDSNAVGTVRDYYITLSPVPPVTIAYINSNNGESVFAITLRIKVKENTAILPQTDTQDIYLDFNKEPEE